jgi:hypothetical protein
MGSSRYEENIHHSFIPRSRYLSAIPTTTYNNNSNKQKKADNSKSGETHHIFKFDIFQHENYYCCVVVLLFGLYDRSAVSIFDVLCYTF